MEGDGSWSPDELIANLGGDTELARQMAALFVVEAPHMLSVVRKALADGSPGTLRRAAHALKARQAISHLTVPPTPRGCSSRPRPRGA